jgi:hypothetical protein
MNPRRILAANIMANIAWTGGAINLVLLSGSHGIHATVSAAAALISIAAAGGIGIIARTPR